MSQANSNVVSLEENRMLSPVELQQLTNSGYELLRRYFQQLIQDFFAKVDDTLFDHAEKAENNAIQNMYFDAMRIVRADQKSVETSMIQTVLDSYKRFWKLGPQSIEIKEGQQGGEVELVLVDENELEESLAITNMTSKGESRYQEILFAIEHRFTYLSKGVEVHPKNNPIGPAIICRSFQHAMKAVDIDLKVKIAIYKLFDEHVIKNLGRLYDESNDMMIEAKVLPNLKLKITTKINPETGEEIKEIVEDKKEEDKKEDKKEEAEEKKLTPQDIVEQRQEKQAFNEIQSLLEQQRAITGKERYDGEVEASSDEVLSALTLLQNDNVSIMPGSEGIEIQRMMLDEIKKLQTDEKERGLSHADDDTIDAVRMLFDFILDDPNLPDPMKAVISRLQIPILKVAVADKAFFGKKKHPARQLLDEFAKAGLGWNESDGKSDKGLYGHMSNMVQRVLKEFHDDVAIFDELLEEFRGFVQKEQQVSRVMEQRTQQVTQGKESFDLAKQRANEEVDKRLKDKKVPSVVESLLKEGWVEVLQLIFLRQGTGSEAWKKASQAIDKLIWSLEAKTTPETRKELIEGLPKLLKELREGLSEISYDQHKMTKWFKDLHHIHIRSLHGKNNIETVKTPPAPVAESAPKTKMSPAEQKARQRLQKAQVEQIELSDGNIKTGNDDQQVQKDEYDRMAEEIQIGTWLEMRGHDGKQRIKLSWKSEVSSLMVFVNRRGVKIAEMTKQGLAAAFRRGAVEILTEVPLMDRAISAMMDKLKAAS